MASQITHISLINEEKDNVFFHIQIILSPPPSSFGLHLALQPELLGLSAMPALACQGLPERHISSCSPLSAIPIDCFGPTCT